jgi:hypothetical protein
MHCFAKNNVSKKYYLKEKKRKRERFSHCAILKGFT